MPETRSPGRLARWRKPRIVALLLGLAAGLGLAIGQAQADKVGVAAAVNPDAFSSLSQVPNKQLKIGKSIFYDERINTSASGLVQVLLVDGSTFTVGPNSDLVIDRFVYDPKKKTGEMVATFSKGTMRFIGGKLSKNAGGVTVKTPQGVLAIRGGMVQGNGTIWSFLYGVEMTFTSNSGQTQTVFETGYTLDLSGGTLSVRPTTPEDIRSIFTALTSNGGTGFATGTGETPGPSGSQQQTLAETLNLQQLIADATATQISNTIERQEINQQINETPGSTTPGSTTPGSTTPPGSTTDPGGQSPTENPNLNIRSGYTGGVYTQTGGNPDDPRAGTLTSFAPNDFNLVFDKKTGEFQGAAMAVFVDHPSNRGGATFLFSAIDVPDEISVPGDFLGRQERDLSTIGLFAGFANTDSIAIYERTLKNGRPRLANVAQLNSGSAGLVGFTGAGNLLAPDCEDCDDLFTWGFWTTTSEDPLSFQTGEDPIASAKAIGWWVSGDIVKDVTGQLPMTGTAYYDGIAVGEVWNNRDEVPARYTAQGDMSMHWDFADRGGSFTVEDFDKQQHGGHIPGGIDFGGDLAAPGVPTGKLNRFGGNLEAIGGKGPPDLRELTGSVAGSFVGATKLPDNRPGNPKGVIGNWNIGNKSSTYKAGGIFGGSLQPD
jgi:hypothetical protein